jgi:Phosphatidylethanolamine-binding protein
MESSFKLFVLTVCFMRVSNACDTTIPPRVLNGCFFDGLTLVNPSTGFLIAGENCGLEVDKEIFYYQPYVFFANAFDFMKYTLIMVDNDNPICDEGNKYLHWMVTDVDGKSLKYGLGIYGGQTLAGNEKN